MQHTTLDLVVAGTQREMSRLGSACECSDMTSGGIASDASHASQAHASSAMKRVLGNQATSPTKYVKTSAILLGWEPEYCDTGAAIEVSTHIQTLSTIMC